MTPGQHVWYIVRGQRCEGRIVRQDKRGESAKQRHWLIKRPRGHEVAIPESWIIAGEIERCNVEEARARREADTDEWALLGARDWAKEREVLRRMR